MNQLKALIIGGGIGGLAAAIALRRCGASVRVFERAPEVREVGAGLSLWPNGLRALDALGVGAAVRSRSIRDLSSALRRWDGRVIVAAGGAELERRLGDVALVIHRSELLALLRRELPNDAVVTGASCVGFSAEGRGVSARFANGMTASGDVLIGADGIGSVVRARLFGAHPPSYAGYTAWRGVVSFEHTRLLPGIAIGRGSQFGQVPMADGQVYWFATQNGPPAREPPSAGWKAHLLETFAGWHAPIPELLAATPEAAILHNDIIDRPPLARWGHGRITLLGDAAHPMTPNLGQGANQALEDAEALARVLGGHLDPTRALRQYEDLRRERANAVVIGSRRVGRVMQLEQPLACWLRDQLLGTRAATRLQLEQLERLASAAAT
jgi:2-polyprenyl-6-methoxyphenol hydroxylase-like FAD-dependent oxidoreductase